MHKVKLVTFPLVGSVKRQNCLFFLSMGLSSRLHPSPSPPPPPADHLNPPDCTEEAAPSSTCSLEPASCPDCREVGPGSPPRPARPPPPPPRRTHQDGPVGCLGTLRRREERSLVCRGRGGGGGVSFSFC